MEEKKINKLSDEALGQVAGGSGGADDFVMMGANTPMRMGPGLSYEAIDTLFMGYQVPYLGENEKDDRGIKWYKIDFKGRNGWVTSEYSWIV